MSKSKKPIDIEVLKQNSQAPSWLTEDGMKAMSKRLLPGETPKDGFLRVAKAAASYTNNPKKKTDSFFELMWNNFLCLATPVATNMGTDRGLPISCYMTSIEDTLMGESGIYPTNDEAAEMSKLGGGVGIHINNIRPRGSDIATGGSSNGVVPWMRLLDTTFDVVAQGKRRGSGSVTLSIDHPDWDDFIEARDNTGDPRRRVYDLHISTNISDDFMNRLYAGDSEARRKWAKLLKYRHETGESYIEFYDNINNNVPQAYKDKGMKIVNTNICCLTGDTLVATSEGPKRIDSLVGETVTVFDGLNWVETRSFKSYGKAEIWRIHLKDGSYVDCTDNHRWFVASSYNDIRFCKYKETLTKSLKAGDFVEFHNEQTHGTADLKGAYALGFLFGDGTHLSNSTPKLNLHFPKYMCQAVLIDSLSEIPVNEKIWHSCHLDLGWSEEVCLSSTGSYGKQIFKRLKGVAARKDYLNSVFVDKTALPEDCINWSKKTKLEFLSGIFDADATFCKGIQFTNKSKRVVEQIQMLIKTLGYSGSIDRISHNDCWRLSISTQDSFDLLNNELSTRRLRWRGKAPNRKLTGWRKIVKIEKLEGKQEVYCPTLPSTGKFALANGLMTGNSEILQYVDKKHSVVCDLSSLNLACYDQWKSDYEHVISTSHEFLDAVMSEFLVKVQKYQYMQKAYNGASKARAIGLGVLGWHDLLFSKNLPFDNSWEVMQLNAEIFRRMKESTDETSKRLAKEYGEPEWLKGYGERNMFKMAIAPTKTNSAVSGVIGEGIAPCVAVEWTKEGAEGDIYIQNPYFVKILDKYGKNDYKTWKSIRRKKGSVQHLDFLTEDEKKIFLSAREIDQHKLVKQAAQRQPFIDQGQSLNLWFASNSPASYINSVHISAHKLGVKTLYYMKTGAAVEVMGLADCESCEG